MDTVAIVTAPASADLAVLHHRVPVAIREGDFDRWLDCSTEDTDSVMSLMRGPDEGEFVWHEISTRVNQATNDDAQLILPITAEQRDAERPIAMKKPVLRKTAAASDDGQGSLF
jgi:putative SOS response-associated peptidase YedK